MSLQAFQRAICDLVASPDLCRLMRGDPAAVLERYQLSTREQQRLVDMVEQRGMAVNCTLYRYNRITPLYTLMPLTSFLLGDGFIHEVELFWKTYAETDLRFKQEIDRFGEFLRNRLRRGQLVNPLLEEVVDFELTIMDLRFIQRRRILDEIEVARGSAINGLRLHPMVRVITFRHEPATLLRLLKERHPLPYQLDEGEFWLLLDVLDEELQVKKIDPLLGQLLRAIETHAVISLPHEEATALIEARLVVRAEPVVTAK